MQKSKRRPSRFYRVRYEHEGGTSVGYGWFRNHRAATSAAADFRRKTRNEDGDARVSPVEIEITKAGVLEALNRWATYADNG